MAKRPVDVDVKQSIKDIFLNKNEYHLNYDYVISDGKKHPLAILVPGGGYQMVCSFIEGVPIAKKLNAQGISAVIVYYRVRKKGRYPNPMDDLARAVKEIFEKADAYNLDINNYSVWGASAGGHLVASFGTDNMGYLKYGLPKPSSLILTYPVITMDKEYTHIGSHDALIGKDATKELEDETSVEKHIHKEYPPTFIWCSYEDATVPCKNTEMMKEELERNGISHKCNMYHDVDHGVGPATGTNAEGWINEAVEFWRLNSNEKTTI